MHGTYLSTTFPWYQLPGQFLGLQEGQTWLRCSKQAKIVLIKNKNPSAFLYNPNNQLLHCIYHIPFLLDATYKSMLKWKAYTHAKFSYLDSATVLPAGSKEIHRNKDFTIPALFTYYSYKDLLTSIMTFWNYIFKLKKKCQYQYFQKACWSRNTLVGSSQWQPQLPVTQVSSP